MANYLKKYVDRVTDVPPQLLFVHQGQTDSEAGGRDREGARGRVRRPLALALTDDSPPPICVRADKEAHWHRQLPGVIISCAFDGINVWKPDVQTTT